MSFERVTVVADGRVYDEWESVRISQTYNSPIVLIELDTTEVIAEAWKIDTFTKWNFPPGTIIHVYGSGDFLAVGVVDVYRPVGTPTTHKVKIVARSFPKKGVDYSYPAGRGAQNAWSNTPFCDIMRDLWESAYGIRVVCDSGANQNIKYHQVRMGATPYQESMQLAPLVGADLRGMRDGALHFASGEMITNSGGYIVQGVNIISMSAEIKAFPRAAVHIAKSQDPQEHRNHDGIAEDSGAYGGTVKIYPVMGYPTQQNVNTFAKKMRADTFLMSVKARVQVPGWRVAMPQHDMLVPGGAFWDTGTLVWVDSQWLKISCNMLIYELEFVQDLKSGTTTTLSLVSPDAVMAAGTTTQCNNAAMWDYLRG